MAKCKNCGSSSIKITTTSSFLGLVKKEKKHCSHCNSEITTVDVFPKRKNVSIVKGDKNIVNQS